MARKQRSGLTAISLPCAYCRATGKDRFGVMSPLSSCPVCQGRKENILTGLLIDCAYCHKTGISPTGTRNPCLACGGKGVLPQAGRTCLCPKCCGSGIDTAMGFYCYQCHGSGLVQPERKSEIAVLRRRRSSTMK